MILPLIITIFKTNSELFADGLHNPGFPIVSHPTPVPFKETCTDMAA
jgi:hypothetical protein